MATRWKDIHDIAEVVELIPGTPYAKKIKCKLCQDIVFEVSNDANKKDNRQEMVRLSAHMAIQHQLHVEHEECDDPNCLD